MNMNVGDNRVFERVTARFPTKFKDSRHDYGTTVFLRDISADGMRIASKERLLLDDKVDVQINLPDDQGPVSLNGRVVWLRENESRSYEAGLKFDAVNLMATRRIFRFCH